MARITDAGVVTTSLAGYRDRLEAIFRDVFSVDIDLSPESPQGQLIGALSLVLTEVDEAIAALSNSFSVQRASGVALDDLVSILGVYRRPATFSEVTATLNGFPGTIIPAGTQARTTAGQIFAATASVTLPAAGAADVLFRAVQEGAIPVPAGVLTERVDAIGGWQGVNNPSAGTEGRARESDMQLRQRYSLTLAHNAVGSPESIRAALLDAPGVARATVTVNSTAAQVTMRGTTIAPHSIACVVAGSATDADIAQAIAESLNVGAGTSGTESTTHTFPSGTTLLVAFTREVQVPVRVTLNITLASGFPSGGLDSIADAVLSYTGGLGIGDVVDRHRMIAQAVAVPGWLVGALTIARKVGMAGVETETELDLAERVTLDRADLAITVT